MKTRILVLVSLLLAATSFGAFAAKESREKPSLSELIKKEVPYPEFAKDLKLDGTVEVYLVMDTEGVHLMVQGTEAHLVEYVKTRLSTIEDELKEAFLQNNKNHYRFKFRHIK